MRYLVVRNGAVLDFGADRSAAYHYATETGGRVVRDSFEQEA